MNYEKGGGGRNKSCTVMFVWAVALGIQFGGGGKFGTPFGNSGTGDGGGSKSGIINWKRGVCWKGYISLIILKSAFERVRGMNLEIK